MRKLEWRLRSERQGLRPQRVELLHAEQLFSRIVDRRWKIRRRLELGFVARNSHGDGQLAAVPRAGHNADVGGVALRAAYVALAQPAANGIVRRDYSRACRNAD